MASPRRIFTVYELLFQNAQEIHDFQVAKGEQVSGTVKLLLSGNRDKLLQRWGEEMHEICGVLGGTHDDPYIVEATQCFYWGSLYAVSGGVSWEELTFDQLRTQVGQTGIDNIGDLGDTVDRLVALGADTAKPQKCFLLWCVADRLYRELTPIDKQWGIDQLMDYDLADMKKRSYLEPILKQTESL